MFVYKVRVNMKKGHGDDYIPWNNYLVNKVLIIAKACYLFMFIN